MRIGLIADIHMRDPQGTLPPTVSRAFEGVDQILVCGDLGKTTKALDELEAIAPVLALRSGDAPAEEDRRLVGATYVVEAEGVRVGMCQNMLQEEPAAEISMATQPPFMHSMTFPPGMTMQEFVEAKLGQGADIIAFGGTHYAFIVSYQGTLFVSTGSPTIPARGGSGAPEVAVLDIHDRVVSPRIIDLRTLAS